MLKICSVDKNSLAADLGLQKDDVIVSFDGEKAVDMLDVAFFDSKDTFDVTIDRQGEKLTFSVEKDVNESVGWNFYENCYLTPRNCANKCIFCFVDQLPKGQRKSLYVKDDDWRLSFVSGNYVTLTNISERELQRICAKKFSPLYVSVHATDDDVRRFLLGNNRALPILPVLRRLISAGIKINAQVVLVPEVNDGEVLQRTLRDLYDLNGIETLAVVPVGLTKFRTNLPTVKPVSKSLAQDTIALVEGFDKECFDKDGRHFVYCSDEMYVYAEAPVPPHDYYGDFEQLENGVGLIADFRYQFALAFSDATAAKPNDFLLVTGKSFAPYLTETIELAKRRFPSLKAKVLAVENKFFGETVTVAGLLVGEDICEAVKNEPADTLLLPRVMLREIEDVFLDGMTLAQLRQRTKKNIVIVADGYETCCALLECDE